MQEPPPAQALIAELRQFGERLESTLFASHISWSVVPAAGAWSLTVVCCHLRDVEREIHQTRLRRLIRDEGAFLPGVVADAWAEERRYDEQDGPMALADFLMARKATLGLLESLEPEIWQRRGQHAFFGSTTTHELVYLMVQHDRAHWEQIQELTTK